MSDGLGDIAYNTPSISGAKPPFVNFGGARNGTSLDAGSFVTLGQDINQAGSPATLLNNREVPMNGNELSFINLLGSSPVKSFIHLFSESGLLPLQVIQNGDGTDNVGNGGYFLNLEPANYGTVYNSTIAPGGTIRQDRWYLGYAIGGSNDPGGMPDDVLNFGYNIQPGAGRVNSQDAAWRFGFETNFAGSPAGVFGLDFEFHLPEITTFGGTLMRLDSMYVDKATGANERQMMVNTLKLSDNNNTLYMELAPSNSAGVCGSLNLFAPGGGNQWGIINWVTANASIAYQPFFNGLTVSLDAANCVLIERDGRAFLNRNNIPGSTQGAGNSLIGGCSVYSDPDPSAQLDVFSTVKGFLPPRMTNLEKLAIPAPVAGLIVYDTTLKKLSVFTGGVWETVTSL